MAAQAHYTCAGACVGGCVSVGGDEDCPQQRQHAEKMTVEYHWTQHHDVLIICCSNLDVGSLVLQESQKD